ncbi:MAG: lamin tail domain-containing protein [Planctomycetota bacterium]
MAEDHPNDAVSGAHEGGDSLRAMRPVLTPPRASSRSRSPALAASVLAGLFASAPGCDRTTAKDGPRYAVLNEVCATETVPAPSAEALGKLISQPWVEIHNPNPFPVSLDGYSLTDNYDRPRKFRFPRGRILGPGEYLIVFLFDPVDCLDACIVGCRDRCLEDCADAFDDCRRACAGRSGVALEDCLARCESARADCDSGCLAYGEVECSAVDESFRDCRSTCAFGGLATGFRLSRRDETLYLFAEDGGRLVDRIDARDQADAMTYGVDPETGKLGAFYLPTPAAPNRLANFRPHVFVDLPRRDRTSDCVRSIPVRFRIARDAKPDRGPLEVRLDCAESPGAGCADLANALGALDPPAGIFISRLQARTLSTRREVDRNRAGAGALPIAVEVEVIEFEAQLPPKVCGTVLAYQAYARDPDIADSSGKPLEIRSPAQCVVYGEEVPRLLVGEYQPRNSRIAFERFGEFDRLKWPEGKPPAGAAGEIATPDWIEVVNLGEETADITLFGLATAGDIRAGAFDRWLFGFQGSGRAPASSADVPTRVLLAPGEARLVLADADGGRNRRWYYRSPIDDESREAPYYSTHFALAAGRKPPQAFDDFYLVDSATRTILDRVVLDFSANEPPEPAYDILPDRSAGRFEAEGAAPDALRPGTITDCPTPGAPNLRDCEVAPAFAERATRESASGFGCPRPLEAVVVRTRVHFDRDTVRASDRRVDVEASLGGGPFEPLDPASVAIEPAPASAVPAPASAAYDLAATLPGASDGTLVVFRFVAQDFRLARAGLPQGEPVVFGEETAPGVSFRYLVGHVPPADGPRLNEVLPGNRSIDLPPFACLPKYERPHPDFVEVHNPSNAPLDLGGYYLADEADPETPIGRARRWRFPDGTIVPAGGFAAVYFAEPPECLSADERGRYIFAQGIGLKACGETLYLIAPDEPERGANCIADSLSWNLPPPRPGAQAPCFPLDTTLGYRCEGPAAACRELVSSAGATPGRENHGPPLVHDSFHEDALSGAGVDGCVSPSGSLVVVQTIFFLDAKLPVSSGALGLGVESAALLVDRGAGEEEVPCRVVGFAECGGTTAEKCARPPVGRRNVNVSANVPPRADLGRFPPVVSYRVVLADALGASAEAGPFTFGTTEGAHPALSLNEVNRASALPGAEGETAWVEIFNRSGSSADLSGMFLGDDLWNPRKAAIPEGTVVPPRSAAVVVTGGAAAAGYPRVDLPWAVEAGGYGSPALRSKGRLFLLDRPDRGSCVVDSVSYDFGGLAAGASLGRVPDGSGSLAPLSEPSPGAANARTFVRGDADEDGRVNVTDIAHSLRILFAGETRIPACLDALDADDDGVHTATDPIYLGNALFRGGPTVPPPFPEPGLDPTPDDVSACSVGG